MDEPTSPALPRRSLIPWLIGGALAIAAAVVGYFLIAGSDEGSVVFNLSEPMAAVRYKIDGKDFMPQADNSATLPEGKYVLTVTGDEFETRTIPFHVRRGGKEIMKIELQRKPKTPDPVIDPVELQRRRDEAADIVAAAAKLLEDNKPKDAMPLLDQALALDPKSARGYALRGQAFFAQDQLGKARDDETASSKLATDNPDLLLLKSMFSLRDGDAKSGNLFASRALDQNPRLISAHALIGEALLREGKLTEGLDACHQALIADPRQLRAWRNRALAYGSLGQWEKALADLDMVIHLDEGDAYAYLAKAAALAQLGKLEPARAERILALKLNPKLVRLTGPVFGQLTATFKVQAEELAAQARKAFDQQSWDKAVDLADAALKLDPKCAGAIAYRGAVRFVQEEKEKAKVDCEEAIKLDSGQWRAYLTRALIYEDEERVADKIVADATIAVTLAPQKSAAYTRRAVGYLRLHEVQQALADGEAALAQSEKYNIDPTNYHTLGEANARLRNLDKALAHFDNYVKLKPRDADGYYWRAGVHDLKEDTFKTLADMKKAAELDEDNYQGDTKGARFPPPPKDKVDVPVAMRAERARQNAKAGRLDSAIADWTIALQPDLRSGKLPQDCLEPKWHFERGLVYFARGDFAQAADDFEQAIKSDSKQADLLWHLAEARGKMGDCLSACATLDEALQLDGKNAKYLWHRAALRQRVGDLLGAADDRDAAIQLDAALAKAQPPTFPDLPHRLLARNPVFIPWGGPGR
jgi:tetratricopeptide (TPR) repeat protein